MVEHHFWLGFAVAFAVYVRVTRWVGTFKSSRYSEHGRSWFISWSSVIPMSIAQVLGVFVGSAITIVHYYPHFKITTPEEGNVVLVYLLLN